jgi:hypothetical protein
MLPDLIDAANNFNGAVNFFLHPERSNLDSDFLVLRNYLQCGDKLLFEELPFKALLGLLQENLKALGTPSGTLHPALFMDFGFTGRHPNQVLAGHLCVGHSGGSWSLEYMCAQHL